MELRDAMRGRLGKLAAVSAALGVGSVLWMLPRYLRAASVLSQSAQLADPTGLTGLVRSDIGRQEREVPTQRTPVKVRVYEPAAGKHRSPVLLVHGIHPEGIDEPRFVTLAEALAAVGHPVWTPYLPELSGLAATVDTVTRLHDVAEQLAEAEGQSGIGFGISVGGGLLLLAAARPDPMPPLHRVITLGAHHDLVRVARHYAGEVARDVAHAPTTVSPHPYGLWVLAHAHVDRVFSSEDAEAARDVIGAWIDADSADGDATGRLSAEGKRLVADLRREPVGEDVRARLLSAIEAASDDLRSVSPVGKLDHMRAETLLLHGSDDPVVPPTELSWLWRELPERCRGRALVTPVLAHAEFPAGKALAEHLSLLRFVVAMLSD